MKILSIITEYIKEHPSCNFHQALHKLGISESIESYALSKFCEHSRTTCVKLDSYTLNASWRNNVDSA